MKAIVLAGGLPSTLSKEHEHIPKPMVEIGGKPMLWHIMKSLSNQGINEFVVCGGYKIETIKSYLQDFYVYQSDITVDLATNVVTIHKKRTENWIVTIVDTGIDTALLKRIEMVAPYIDGDFYVTFGDCLSNISISQMYETHQRAGKLATISLVKPTGRKKFLSVKPDDTLLQDCETEMLKDSSWVSGDSFMMKREAISCFKDLPGDMDSFVSNFETNGELNLYKHLGYWTSIETMNDLVNAENLWNQGKAPWVKA